MSRGECDKALTIGCQIKTVCDYCIEHGSSISFIALNISIWHTIAVSITLSYLIAIKSRFSKRYCFTNDLLV